MKKSALRDPVDLSLRLVAMFIKYVIDDTVLLDMCDIDNHGYCGCYKFEWA